MEPKKLKHVEKLSDGPAGLGTRYRAEFVSGDPMTIEYVRFDRPSAWSTIGNSQKLQVSFAGEVRPTDKGAHLVMRMDLRAHGLLRFATPLLRRYMQSQQKRNVSAIKAVLET